IARGVLRADRAEVRGGGVGPPFATDVDPQNGSPAADLRQRHADRARVARRIPVVVVVPIPVDLAVVAIPLVAILADHVAAVTVHARSSRETEPYAPIWSLRDALLHSLCGCAVSLYEQPRITHDAPHTCFHW